MREEDKKMKRLEDEIFNDVNDIIDRAIKEQEDNKAVFELFERNVGKVMSCQPCLEIAKRNPETFFDVMLSLSHELTQKMLSYDTRTIVLHDFINKKKEQDNNDA